MSNYLFLFLGLLMGMEARADHGSAGAAKGSGIGSVRPAPGRGDVPGRGRPLDTWEPLSVSKGQSLDGELPEISQGNSRASDPVRLTDQVEIGQDLTIVFGRGFSWYGESHGVDFFSDGKHYELHDSPPVLSEHCRRPHSEAWFEGALDNQVLSAVLINLTRVAHGNSGYTRATFDLVRQNRRVGTIECDLRGGLYGVSLSRLEAIFGTHARLGSTSLRPRYRQPVE